MADSFSTSLRQRFQQTGANNNVWGSLLNAAALQLLEDAIAGGVSKVVAGVDITLSTNNGALDEARKAVITLTGSPGATRNIIIPNVAKLYVFVNLTDAIQNVKTSAGTALAVAVGEKKFLLCDGADVVRGIADTLGGLDASAFAKLAQRNSYSAGNADVPVTMTDAATVTMDLELGNVFKVTLGGDRVLDITHPIDGSWAEMYVTQDATGGRDLDFPNTIIWEGGVEPTLSGIPNVTEKFFFRYDIDTTSYFGVSEGAFVAGGGGVVVSTTLVGNEFNVDIFERAGRPAGAASVTVTVAAGSLISSFDPATPALDFSGFVAGSTIAIINEGDIQGCGGRGGRGGYAGDVTSADIFARATAGTPGGDAIRLPSTACTINITNANGRIWGGGGGGGGGGPSSNGSGSDVGSTGGGGGGGAGGGVSGDGGGVAAAVGTPGVSGGRGRNGTFGAGGAGVSTGGGGGAAAGGAGGDWGTAGSNGGSDTSGSLDALLGPGGAAGKAVNVNGGTAPTFISGSGSPNVKGAVA